MMKSVILATALIAAPALAQTAPATSPQAPAAAAKPTVGATVLDQSGAPVGTISRIAGDAVEIDTGTNKAGVPMSAIGTNAKGLYTTVTKAQLDAAAAQAKSQTAAALTAGATVKGANGQALGTIKASDAQFVTLTTTDGKDVRLPANAFAAGPDGVKIGMTAEQFQQAVAGATPSTTTGTSASTATGTSATTAPAAPGATTSTSPAATTGADASTDSADATAAGSVAGATPSPGTTPAPAATPKATATPKPAPKAKPTAQ